MDINRINDDILQDLILTRLADDFDRRGISRASIISLAHFIRLCVKDSTPKGLTVEEIVKIINRHDDGDSLDDDKVDVLASAIHAAQERKGKDDHVA